MIYQTININKSFIVAENKIKNQNSCFDANLFSTKVLFGEKSSGKVYYFHESDLGTKIQLTYFLDEIPASQIKTNTGKNKSPMKENVFSKKLRDAVVFYAEI